MSLSILALPLRIESKSLKVSKMSSLEALEIKISPKFEVTSLGSKTRPDLIQDDFWLLLINLT